MWTLLDWWAPWKKEPFLSWTCSEEEPLKFSGFQLPQFSKVRTSLLLVTTVTFFEKANRNICVGVLVTQWCPTLCDPMDCNQQGSSVHGVLQARILEWVAISFSGSSRNPGIEPGLPHCRHILYHLNHRGSLYIYILYIYTYIYGSHQK